MDQLTGTWALVRLALRRDRIMLPAWIAVFVVMATFSAKATIDLYPTTASVVEVADSLNDTPSLVALYGRIYDPASVGAVALWKMGGIGSVLVCVLAIITVVRHTRSDEAAGRLELVGAAAVGRFAALPAALVVAVVTNAALGLVTAVGLTVVGLPTVGSIAFGLAWFGLGVAFAGVGAVTAQLARSGRAANGLGAGLLACAYLVRAVGDTSDGALSHASWLSPIGWSQRIRPFAGEAWWVLALLLAAAVLLGVAAFVLNGRRDLGAGLLADRAGPPRAHRLLASPLALALRLHRGTVIGWATALFVLCTLLGSVAGNVADLLDNPRMRDFFTALGGEKVLTDTFLAAEMSIIGMVVAAYTVQATMRLRSEETAQRAEPVLATSVGRTRWAGSHVLTALAGTAALLVVAGLGMGAGHALETGDPEQIPRLVAAALVHLPPALIMGGIVVAAFGLAPRAVVVGWVFMIGFFLLGELGPLFQIDQRVIDLSPFTHVPKLPGSELTLAPLLWLTAIAAVLTAVGLVGFRRRDVG
jgi:ABC-2 type transport system permease protein